MENDKLEFLLWCLSFLLSKRNPPFQNTICPLPLPPSPFPTLDPRILKYMQQHPLVSPLSMPLLPGEKNIPKPVIIYFPPKSDDPLI